MTITPTLDKATQTVTDRSDASGDDQYESKIVYLDDGRFLVLWTENSDVAPGDAAGTDILAQVYTAFGDPVGAAVRVNFNWFADDEGEFTVAKLPGNRFVVAFCDTDGSGTSIRAEEWTVAANHTFTHDLSLSILNDPGALEASNPVVSVRDNGSYFVAYAETDIGVDTAIRGKAVVGGVVGSQVSLIAPGAADIAGREHNSIATLSNGNYVIVAEQEAAGDSSIWLRVVDENGGNAVVATEVGSTDGNALSDSEPAVAALTGGGFVVLYTNTDVNDTDLLWYIYDNNGVSSANGSVNGGALTDDNISAAVIGLRDGGFLVVYNDNEDDFIRGQRYDAAGSLVGDRFDIAHDTDVLSVFDPALSLTDDGRVIVSWSSLNGISGNANTQFAIYDPRTGPYVGDGTAERIHARQDGTGPDGDFEIDGGGGSDTIYGRNGNDTMQGGSANDTIYGGNGDDTLEGNGGADYLDGGAGADELNYEGSDSVLVRLWNQTASGNSAEGDTIAGFEHFYGGAGNDTVAGSDGVANRLTGNIGNDVLFGLSGDDTIRGGSGMDNMDGGTGNDFVDFSDDAVGVTVRLWNQTASGGIAAGDTINGFESAAGGNGGDAIVGSDGVANLLIGNGGNDTLFALSGDDTIRGGSGADNMNGGDGIDTVDYSDATAKVTVRLWNQTAADDIAAGDVLAGFENAIGGSGGDAIVASDGVANKLFGNAGADTLYGLSGNDTIEGGSGADVINGGDGIDFISFSSATSGVKIKLWNGTGLDGDAQGDTYASIEGVVGSAFNDVISGSAAVDNTIFAGAGNDTMYGNTGNDTFVFFKGYDADTIGDFIAGNGANEIIRVLNFGAAFDTFTEVFAAATQMGVNTVINFGDGDTLTLLGVTKANLNAADFLFS